ncbi:2OG-Fe(II) oxygenase [Rugamonas sp. CCM 8940]
MHQETYGDLEFTLQMEVLQSQAGEDFDGGHFVQTEQRPRM